MDKIKSLLQKAGVSEELATQICESLNVYRSTLREEFEKEYTAKVQKAKQVCLEETEAHKLELARRLQIFCEAKGTAIEAQLAKQSAFSESEALAKLRTVRSLVEGIQLDSNHNGQSTAVVEKARKQIHEANGEKSKALAVANRQTAIAEKALKENRRLTTELARLKQLSEGRRPAAPANRQSQRIDESRSRRATPTTTRQTLLEAQDPHPAPGRQTPQTVGAGAGSPGYSVNDIASTMETDLI